MTKLTDAMPSVGQVVNLRPNVNRPAATRLAASLQPTLSRSRGVRRTLLLLAPLACFAASTMPPEADQRLAHDIYKQIVEIKSGFTTGATTPVVSAIATRLLAAGFPDADIFIGGAIPTKANLVVRYRGTGKLKPILLLAHTDVVEARREDWTTDPFVFTEKDGYYYGRGTADDKAQAAVWIANLIRYKREGYKPDRDIVVALTADEEGGGPYNGVDWLIKNHKNLIDADFALNEGGKGTMVGGKRVSNEIQAAEKWYLDVRLEVHNKGGHSSQPVPDNAIYRLAARTDSIKSIRIPAQDYRGYSRVLRRHGQDRYQPGKVRSRQGGGRRRRSHEARGRRFSGLELYAADHLCRHHAGRRSRAQRAAAARRG